MNFLANPVLLKHIYSAGDDNTHKGMDFIFISMILLWNLSSILLQLHFSTKN